MSNPTVLTLVRHGETIANLDGVWHGSIDTPLTERGRRQAERVAGFVGERFREARALYTSDLQRALHTAQAIGSILDLEPRTDPDLREYALGSWEGKTFQELMTTHRLWHEIKRDPHFAPHGGESPRQVVDRFSGALRRIADAHVGERVVVVAHGGALSMVLGHLLDGDYSQWRRVMDNCAVSELVFEPEPALSTFNHTEHLEGV